MNLAILGGGVAGLSAALAAERRGLSYQLFEAGGELGGNARTFDVGGFRFDSGAHRLHDRFPEVTQSVRELLGSALGRVEEPSRILYGDKFVEFPLEPRNLIRNLPLRHLLRAGFDFARSRLSPRPTPTNFEQLAIQRYGRAIAEPFLISYSEKLWGCPAKQLSIEVAGRRIEGLDVRRMLRPAKRTPGTSEHLEGSFFYPRDGIGSIAQAMADACSEGRLQTDSPVTAIECEGRRVRAVVLRGGRRIAVSRVISTMPLALNLALLRPAPPDTLLDAARGLEFRDVILVALFLRRACVSRHASTYFPEERWPFTRVHEPTVRSVNMSPAGHTSLVAEIPCFTSDSVWGADDKALELLVANALMDASLIDRGEVVGSAVRRLHNAYPVLRTETSELAQELRAELEGLENLDLVGRAATFRYLHLHDLIRSAIVAVDALQPERELRPLGAPAQVVEVPL